MEQQPFEYRQPRLFHNQQNDTIQTMHKINRSALNKYCLTKRILIDNGLTLVKADKGETLAVLTRKQYKDKMKQLLHNIGGTWTNFGLE